MLTPLPSVKPDATPEEVRAVVEDPTAGTQIFTRAVCSPHPTPSGPFAFDGES